MTGFLLSQYCVIFFVLCGGPQLANCRGQSNGNRLTSEGPPNSITRDQVLLSPNAKFALGFFTPASINGDNVVSTNSTMSKNHYLGIWINNIAQKTVVWVANRENPVVATTTTSNNQSGILKITKDGNIGVFNGDGGVLLWSSNITASSENTTATLLDTGNLILTRGAKEDKVWQSFEHPTSTLIPGMRLSFNLRTGVGQRIYAWRIPGKDPTPSLVSAGFDPKYAVQMMLWNGTKVLWRDGPWNGKRTTIIKKENTSSVIVERIVRNDMEVYYIFYATEQYSTVRTSLDVLHGKTSYLWRPETKNWTTFRRVPSLPCETYNHCGPFGTCDVSAIRPCKCLQGFQPKNRNEWYTGNFTGGCVRRSELIGCGGEFVKFKKMKFPDKFTLLTNLSARQCKVRCGHSCDCIAYAFANFTQVLIKVSRCFHWHVKFI